MDDTMHLRHVMQQAQAALDRNGAGLRPSGSHSSLHAWCRSMRHQCWQLAVDGAAAYACLHLPISQARNAIASTTLAMHAARVITMP